MKAPVKRMKKQATDWEKILTNHISTSPDKGPVSRIYKHLSNSRVKIQAI